MPTAKVKTQLDGAEREVEIDVAHIPDAVILEHAAVKGKMIPSATFEAELARRGIGIAKGQGYKKEEELENDEAFVKKILEKNKVGGSDAERAEALAKRIRDERVNWDERELKPVKQAAEKQAADNKAQIERLTIRGLHKEIVAEAAAAGIKPALLKSMDDVKGTPPIVAMTQNRYRYDPATDGYYVRDGEGYKYSSKATKDEPYMTIREDLEAFARNKDNAELIVTNRQGGPGLGATGGGGGGGDGSVMLTPEEYTNPQTYEAALKRVGGDYAKVKVVPQKNAAF